MCACRSRWGVLPYLIIFDFCISTSSGDFCLEMVWGGPNQMGETIGFIRRNHLPHFFSPAACVTPFPAADRHPSARARLYCRIRLSLTAATLMAVAHGPYATIPVTSRSRVDATLG